MSTFVIGDIHGHLDHLQRLWERLPELDSSDTVVFLGDYVDRGPDSRGVIEFVRKLEQTSPAQIITLRGNHEQILLDAYDHGEYGLLIPTPNGCLATYLSFTGETAQGGGEQFMRRLKVKEWLPEDIYQWLSALRYWYEDEHAIYVHAGLEGEGSEWLHPQQSDQAALLWMREEDFWINYQGKRLVFGHTITCELPTDHLNFIQRYFDDREDVWIRGNLIGVDTACGKGGFLSAIELPSLKVYESR